MADEFVRQDYRPSAKCRLIIRLDNLLDSDVIKGQVPPKPSKNVKGIKDERTPLRVVEDPDAPFGTKRFFLESQAGTPGTTRPGGVASNTRSSDDHTFELAGIIPRKAEWGINGIRIADTLNLEIRWMDMPFDPRVIRSAAVFYYLGTIDPTDFAMGVSGLRRTKSGDAGEPLNLVPDSFIDANGAERSNLRFQGWVDKWTMTWGDDEPIIKLDCCDNTRMLIDQQHPPQLTIDPKKPIDEAVATLLSHFPQMAGFSITYRPTTVRNENVPPRLSKVLTGAAAIPGLGTPSAKSGGAAGGETNNVWDYLTDVCGAIGHSIRVEGTEIVIQRPRAIYNSKARRRVDDPYRTRTLQSGEYPVRAMIYGRNIKELEIAHEYTRKKAINIEVRSYSPGTKSVVVGRFPEKGDASGGTKNGRIIAVNPGDGVADQKWTVFRVPGIKDPKLAKKIAEDVYNLIGRQELTVRLKTKNLASFGAGNADPDLLDIRAGDDIEVLVNRERGTSSVTDREHSLTGRGPGADLLASLGYPPELADAYEEVYTNANFQRTFRLKEAKIDWDASGEGVSIDLLAINYIEARVDRTPSDFETDKDEDPEAPR